MRRYFQRAFMVQVWYILVFIDYMIIQLFYLLGSCMSWEIISSAVEMHVNYRETNIAMVLQPQVFRMTNIANQRIDTATRSCTFCKS